MVMGILTSLILLFFMCFPSAAYLLNQLQLPNPLRGPESLAFDRNGGGPYVGSSDGRIFKYVATGPRNGSFVEYGYSSPTRNKTVCDGLTDFSDLQTTCGRPLGLGFNHQTNELYVADAYFGLVKIGPNGGPPTQLVDAVQGTPLRFTDALDVDPETGIVYFAQSSANFQIRNLTALINSRDSSGSLFRYDPSTNQTTELLRGLAFAAGVAVSSDGSFVLVTEFSGRRIQRFWLKGQRANTSDIFARIPGSPDNIKRNPRNQFWVAVNNPLGPPPPPLPPFMASGIRISDSGIPLQIVPLVDEYRTQAVSEVQEFNGTLYGGSLFASYAVVFTP
ncbi:hypothetical protein HN51_003144 [Arachis hypogaea]|uniref:Strictosidine synthase conserved region domain-containing protein n=1 Tax=Arachis hypogaea TaxID=3818 RepID=A0A445EJS0_ARAHY|nr:protein STRICTOSIDINE SYNTHASE-LIKE 11 [Arachis hypogaea]QHO51472.1 Protein STRICTOSIDINE SYNTHASE-LIKE [Arachis hypogaea]RYR75709.1 hypothetical protein Ahy_A01g000279 [Arachis hypogaea]